MSYNQLKNPFLILTIFISLFFYTGLALGADEASLNSENSDYSLNVIVIDPGHGGVDTGAIGPGGTHEKDLTLSIALKLYDLLSDETGAIVLLTRATDEYLSLNERTLFANDNRADIFISIHINAARRQKARGVETYFLSFDASDDDARMAAAFENNLISTGEEIEKEGPKNDIESILWDLAQTEAHIESSMLAEAIYFEISNAVRGGNRGVKQAPFIVLVGATMPAVLVEAGFISNPKEEKKLLSERVQDNLAGAIKTGVLAFSEELKKKVGVTAGNVNIAEDKYEEN